MEWTRGSYLVSDDPDRLDLNAVHVFLTQSYWAEGISRELVVRAAQNSLTFALRWGERQVGYARVVTDRTSFAYLCDVYVLKEHRGQGLGQWLVECVVSHPDLQGLRRWLLATRDAHGLYQKFGFAELDHPEVFMHITRRDIYRQGG